MKSMETRLISSIPIEEFIEKNGLYHVNEKISNSSTNEFNFNRRQFLKIIGVGVIGLNLPFVLSINRAEGFNYGLLIMAAMKTFEIASLIWDVYQKMHGNIALVNESKETKRGAVNFELDDVYRNVFSGELDYTVPPRTINKYRYHGPYSEYPGLFDLTARTQIASNTIKDITVRVG